MKALYIRALKVVLIVALFLGIGRDARADFTFGNPKNLGIIVNSEKWDLSPCLSTDSLSLFFSSDRTDGAGSFDIWLSTRPTIEEAWLPAENLGPLVNSSSDEYHPAISPDGLELYFTSFRSGGLGGADLWVTKRATKNDSWGEPVNLDPPVNSANHETFPSLSADGLELYFTSGQTGTAPELSFYMTKRETKDTSWGEPISLGPILSSWPCQFDPKISSDGLLLVFSDYRNYPIPPGEFANRDLWFTMRATKEADWESPVNLGPIINTAFTEADPMISADGSMLYFSSDRLGVRYTDLYEAPILPIVDFDSDGSVWLSDLLTFIDCWGTDELLCDIGPMPWGDGVVDVADLEVLMNYWGQDVYLPDPNARALTAHWKLDESEGTTAHNSSSTNHATLLGDPIWQSVGGRLDGALELDGIDDGAEAGFVLDPKESPFSAFAWVKGGGPGQVIISQAKGDIGRGINWLLTDSSEGSLKSEFNYLDPETWGTGPDLVSWTQITDGLWHHVGLVWDSFSMRILYVDGIEVAKDTFRKGYLEWQDGGINIGFQASIMHQPGYWSGLIDDVRIYSRALTAEQIAALSQ